MNGLFENREIFAGAAAFFAAATVGGLVALRFPRVRVAASVLAIFAWAMLSWALFERGTQRGSLPVADIFEVFQCLGWFAFFSIIFLRVVWSLRVPAIFGSGAATLLCAIAFAGGNGRDNAALAAGTPAVSPWGGVHAGFATVGYACFTAAAIVWLIYLIQNHALRTRRMEPFFARLPDLASLDRIGGRLCAAGLVIFGVGAVLGAAVLLCGIRLPSALAVYKIALSFALFFGFAGTIFLRRAGHISPLKSARAGLAIFCAAIVLLGGFACIKNAAAPEVSTEVRP